MKTEPSSISAFSRECVKQGLDPHSICKHYRMIKEALAEGPDASGPKFHIIDTCRLNNGRMLPPREGPSLSASLTRDLLQRFVAFVPAAGASSRYLKPLSPLLKGLLSKNKGLVKSNLAKLGAYAPLLPQPLQSFVEHPEKAETLTASDAEALISCTRMPKALYPCVPEGHTFLGLKCREHAALGELGGQIFIAPPGFSTKFASQIRSENVGSKVPTQVLEQGKDLSTVRFTVEGEPARDTQGRLSQVPAGHGALVKLFPKAQALFPLCHSLFIRNIDNIAGVSPQVVEATIRFLWLHSKVLSTVQEIRQLLARNDLKMAGMNAKSLHDELALSRPLTQTEQNIVDASADENEAILWTLQFRLFQSTPAQDLITLYRRPVNTLGQVPNTGSDTGGSPVVIQSDFGPMTLCIETPHITEADRQHFLNSEKTTHFNPVFVAAEIPMDMDPYLAGDPIFWLLASKTWLGREVYYYENALYELIGNSHLANPVFVEIPRFLFNPHKSLEDVAGRSMSSWC